MNRPIVLAGFARRKRAVLSMLAIFGASLTAIKLVRLWRARRRQRPLSQDDMKRIFGPKLREVGKRITKVGWRMAREAELGEVVCTVIDGHMIERHEVREKGSMVIQQDSIDRELYVLGPEQFRTHYEAQPIRLRGVTNRISAWRTRGYNFYQRQGEWLSYEVKEDDLELVPGGKFEAPFTRIPMRLRKGDVLVTESEAQETVYVSRSRNRSSNGNVGTRGNAEVFFVYASPLEHDELRIVEEINCLVNSGALLHLTCGTPDKLQFLKGVWTGEEILHVSAHGRANRDGSYCVYLENQLGMACIVSGEAFVDYIVGDLNCVPRIVVLNICESEALACSFIGRGVQYVIAFKKGVQVPDTACRWFARYFYNELDYSESGSSIRGAFEVGKKMMRADQNAVVSASADYVMMMDRKRMDDLVQPDLTRSSSNCKKLIVCDGPKSYPKGLALRVPFVPEEGKLVGPLVACDFEIKTGGALNAYYRRQAQRVLQKFEHLPARIIHIVGEHGMGKAAFAKQFVRFATLPGGRFFSGGAIVPSSKGVTQQQMKSLFLHKMEKHGIVVSKEGQWRLARPARNGEVIPKVEDGQVVTLYQVDDSTSMVIQQDSVDRELYVLREDKFKKNFKVPGKDLREELFKDETEFQVLQRRGFKWFERKGELLVYRVVEEDLEAFPDDQREFEVPFSLKPQELRLGDPLVTGLPDKEDIYVTRNAIQVYKLTESQRQALDKPRDAEPTTQQSFDHILPRSSSPGTPFQLLRAQSQEEWKSSMLELELSIMKQASKQNWLSARWYNPDGHHAAPRLAGSRPRLSTDDLVGEHQKNALDAWLKQLPENSHALCVLLNPERQLKHEQCRQYMANLLREHDRLYLLIVNNSNDAQPHRLQCQEFPEDKHILLRLSDTESAELFLERINKPAMATKSGQLVPREEVLRVIKENPRVKACKGWIGPICELADSYLLDPFEL